MKINFSQIKHEKDNSFCAHAKLIELKSRIKAPEKLGKMTAFGNAKYCTLENIVEGISSLMSDEESCFDIKFTFCENEQRVSCSLHVTLMLFIGDTMHKYTDTVVTYLPECIQKLINIPKSNAFQEFGSLQTYMSRYALRGYFVKLFDGSEDYDAREAVKIVKAIKPVKEAVKPVYIEPKTEFKVTDVSKEDAEILINYFSSDKKKADMELLDNSIIYFASKHIEYFYNFFKKCFSNEYLTSKGYDASKDGPKDNTYNTIQEHQEEIKKRRQLFTQKNDICKVIREEIIELMTFYKNKKES